MEVFNSNITNYIWILLSICVGYLFGCFSMATIVGRIYNVDLRSKGSKNPGASNVTMLIGKKAGALVAICDIVKGVIPVILMRYLAKYFGANPELCSYVAGVSAVIGHIFPVIYGFRGGKGFATYIGISLALDIRLGLLILLVAIVVALVSDYIVLGTLTVIILNPCLRYHELYYALLLSVSSLIIIYLHIVNIKRICNHTEPKIRKAVKGDYKNSNEF